MLFLEAFARPLLLVHGVAAGVLVGATTHHVVWTRHYLRGDFRKAASEKRFAFISAIAFVVTFALGNMIYPTYKVRVRAEYFDNPSAISDEMKLREAQHARTGLGSGVSEPARTLASVARIFDIKEHWVALGCAASVILLLLACFAHPKDAPRTLTLYVALSAFACGTAWIGLLIGLFTSAHRAVGTVT